MNSPNLPEEQQQNLNVMPLENKRFNVNINQDKPPIPTTYTKCPHCNKQFLYLTRHKRCRPYQYKKKNVDTNKKEEETFSNENKLTIPDQTKVNTNSVKDITIPKANIITNKDIYEHIKFQSFTFYRNLYEFMEKNDISVEIVRATFPKVISYEIEYAQERKYYSDDSSLEEAFLKYKQEEINCFNNEFGVYYARKLNKDKNNNNPNNINQNIIHNNTNKQNTIINIDEEDDIIIDINATSENKTELLYQTMLQLRLNLLTNGKICKFCHKFPSKIIKHIFSTPQCNEFLSKISSSENYFQKRALIVEQMRYCYHKLQKAKFSECCALFDTCFNSARFNGEFNDEQNIKLLLYTISYELNNYKFK